MSTIDSFYRANPLLKKVGIQIEYTQEQIEEYIKCSQSPIYFIKNYVKIINIDKGEILFDLRDYQEEMINTIHGNRRVVGRIGRQSGKSATTVAYVLWATLFQENYSVAILANKGSLAKDLLDRYQKSYACLPKWLQQGVVTFNKTSVELENGSKVLSAATSSSAVRGGSYSLVVLDEYAHVSNNIAEEFFTSVYPVISSGENSKIVVISTSRGLNHYYKLFTDAVAGRNDYVPIDIHWTRIPGRDEKFKEEFIRNTSLNQWMQEIECAFLGSSNTLISGEKLGTLTYLEPINKFADMVIYEEPIKAGYDDEGILVSKDHIYFMTVDVSEGKNLDYSAFSIFDCSVMPYKQVAIYRSNSIPPILYPTVLKACAEYFNNAYVLVEVNNNPQIASVLLNDLEYEYVLKVYAGNAQAQSLTPYSTSKGKAGTMDGLRMSPLVKRVGCSTLKTLVENYKLIITDFTTISELTTFTQLRNSFCADEGCNDDMAMTLVMFGWLTTQVRFKEIVESDIRLLLQSEHFKMKEDDMMISIPTQIAIDRNYFIEDDAVWIESSSMQEYNQFISELFH